MNGKYDNIIMTGVS